MSKRKSFDRERVELADPRPGSRPSVSLGRALEYCQSGVAYFLRDGRLRFRTHKAAARAFSDVYVAGDFNLRIDKTNHFSRLQFGPEYPHLVFDHGVRS